MMIDEAMNRVADRIMRMHNGYVEYLANGGKADKELESDIHALDEVYNALAWYREQDLIQREDVIELLEQHILLDDDFDEEQARFIAENEYRRVPKAEPPNHIGEVTETVNGHCEACIRFTDDDCDECNVCGDEVDYYEPCISKENE